MTLAVDHDAHRTATTTSLANIASDLQDALGQKLVAYGAGVNTPKLVGRWANNLTSPRDTQRKRLRDLYYVARVIRDGGFDDDTVKAFVMGTNPNLNDEAPIDAIREDRGTEAIRAARAFVA